MDHQSTVAFLSADFESDLPRRSPKSGARDRRSTMWRPLRILFIQTDMRIGGAEMITANIIRQLNRDRFVPELCCLKELGSLGEALAEEIPVHQGLLRSKYDVRVLPRLTRLFRERTTDVVITVGAGDKMFWGRLAARLAGVPVVLSALHSTGWPDGVGRLNRFLTPFTDAFIAVAESHGQFLAENLGVARNQVAVIPNGVDTARFTPFSNVTTARTELGISPTVPVVGIVAALRPEKNHELFLDMAARVLRELPDARFLIIGDGPRRAALEHQADALGVAEQVRFTGSRDDIPLLLSAIDVFVLTSHIEANPVSVLEAMSCGKPVVATDVGSIHEVVDDGRTGYLIRPGDARQLADRVLVLLNGPVHAVEIGASARETVVGRWSIQSMVRGYEQLIERVYDGKVCRSPVGRTSQSLVGA